MFTQKPQAANKLASVLTNPGESAVDAKTLKDGLSFMIKRPRTFEDCIKSARLKFQKLFVNDILLLLRTYPLDHRNKDDSLFWTFPKRAPSPIEFSPKDEMSFRGIRSYACLLAFANKIKIPSYVSNQKEFVIVIEQCLKELIIPEFKIDENKTDEK
jgi:hypothetical protein